MPRDATVIEAIALRRILVRLGVHDKDIPYTDVLDLSSKALQGTLLNSIGSLIQLRILHLYNNQITGSLPPTIENLTNLTSLSLWNNRLTGQIPDCFESLCCLTELSLAENEFEGPIPESIGELKGLMRLTLARNHLSGPIPDCIGNLSNLVMLSLDHNQLEGSIPISFGFLSNLMWFSVHKNKLEGEIPGVLGSLNCLLVLNLNNNKFTGEIPDSVGGLNLLRELRLHNNRLTGNIPHALENLRNLRRFNVSNNELSGALPHRLHQRFKRYAFGGNKDLQIDDRNLVKKKFIQNFPDFVIIAAHIIIGYVDLILDIVSIYFLHLEGKNELMILAILFLLSHYFLYLIFAEDFKDVCYVVMSVKPLVEGIRSIFYEKIQTENYCILKMIDAVARSFPNSVLRMWNLLKVFNTINLLDSTVYIVSTCFSVAGIAVTLAGNAYFSGNNMFALRHLIAVVYFLAEAIYRILTVAIMFVSLSSDKLGFAAISLDFFIRFFAVIADIYYQKSNNGKNNIKFTKTLMRSVFVQVFCWMLSDSAMSLTFHEDERFFEELARNHPFLIFPYAISLFESLTFVFIVVYNPFESEIISNLAAYNIDQYVSWAIFLAFFIKVSIWLIFLRKNWFPWEKEEVSNASMNDSVSESKFIRLSSVLDTSHNSFDLDMIRDIDIGIGGKIFSKNNDKEVRYNRV